MNQARHSNGPRRWTRVLATLIVGGLTTMHVGGCETTGGGFIQGAAIGSLAGLGLGSLSGDAGKGAAAGAILGGVTGAVIGNQNERDRVRYANHHHTNDAYYHSRDRGHHYDHRRDDRYHDHRRHDDRRHHHDDYDYDSREYSETIRIEKKTVETCEKRRTSHRQSSSRHYEREYERGTYGHKAPTVVHVHKPSPVCRTSGQAHRHHAGHYLHARPGPSYYHHRSRGSGVSVHFNLSPRHSYGHTRTYYRSHGRPVHGYRGHYRHSSTWGYSTCR